MRHRRSVGIRPVDFSPPRGESGDIEFSSLEQVRLRGGEHEFSTPQRLGFDLLFRIDHGNTVHTVDFTGYRLTPGDVLWVRAGQVHQWGAIDAIDGPVFLFAPTALDDATRELIRTDGVSAPNYWPAADFTHTSAATAFGAAVAAASPTDGLRSAALARLLAATILLLIAHPSSGSSGERPPNREAFIRLRDELEISFRTHHQVAEYAARLGYSTRTLNRLSRDNTGLSAKQFIDERLVLEAKRLLAHSTDPTARIAEHLGFDDPSNFAKYFQHRTGVTPTEFRSRW